MNTSKVHDWLQILTSLGVLAGLILVAYEIRQNTGIAVAEASQEAYNGWTQVSSSELETNIGDIYVRSIEDPESLSSADIFKLNAWYTLIMSQYDLSDAIGRFNVAENFVGIDDSDIEYYFMSEFSRVWFEESTNWIRPVNVKKISDFIETTPVSPEWQFAERIKTKLKK